VSLVVALHNASGDRIVAADAGLYDGFVRLDVGNEKVKKFGKILVGLCGDLMGAWPRLRDLEVESYMDVVGALKDVDAHYMVSTPDGIVLGEGDSAVLLRDKFAAVGACSEFAYGFYDASKIGRFHDDEFSLLDDLFLAASERMTVCSSKYFRVTVKGA